MLVFMSMFISHAPVHFFVLSFVLPYSYAYFANEKQALTITKINNVEILFITISRCTMAYHIFKTLTSTGLTIAIIAGLTLTCVGASSVSTIRILITRVSILRAFIDVCENNKIYLVMLLSRDTILVWSTHDYGRIDGGMFDSSNNYLPI